MRILVPIALLALPFLEFWLLVAVAGQIGIGWTLLALFGASAAGVLVLRRAGLRAHRDVDAALRTGRPPQRGMLDTLMLFAGGVLLAVPGFLTAAAGLLIALPVTRPVLRWAFEGWARRRMVDLQGARVVDAEVVDVEPETGPRPPQVIRGEVLPDDDGRAPG
jgi:UPF0716 protein FxsA